MRRGKMVGFESFSPSFGDGYQYDDYPTSVEDNDEEVNNVDYTTLASSALFSLLGRQPTQHPRTMSHSRMHQPSSAGLNRVRRAETMALPSFLSSLSSSEISSNTPTATPANTPASLSPISRSAPLPASPIQTNLNRERENTPRPSNLSSSIDLPVSNPVLIDTNNTNNLDNENESLNNTTERDSINTMGSDSIFSFEMIDAHMNEVDPTTNAGCSYEKDINSHVTQATSITLTPPYHNAKKIASSPPRNPGFFSVSKQLNTMGIDDLLVSPAPEWALCVICCEVFKNPSIIRCGHSFCYDCVKKLINSYSSPRCALCRTKIGGESDINPNYQMKQVISGLIVRCRYAFEPQSEHSLSAVNNIDNNNSVTIPMYNNSPRSTPNSPTPASPNTMENSSILSLTPNITAQIVPATSNNSTQDKAHSRTLWKLCSNGCKETFEYGNLASHEGICGHAPISCFNEGCTLKVKRQDLETHMINCPYRVIRCSCCRELIQYLDEEKHDSTCPDKIIHCPNKCGQSYTRKESEQHIKQCPASIVRCPHEKYGCKYEGRNDRLADHLSACPYEGIKDYITYTQEQIQQLTQITTMQHQEIRALQKTISAQSNELSMVKRLLQSRDYDTTNNTINHSNFSNISNSSSNFGGIGSSLRATLAPFRRSENDSAQNTPSKNSSM
eukprot:TRINITY_DN4041_c0_g1_i1.p1 TRINITY_DN4041_c0_g1~~TRINITY_DN4041_c0_g1_i1.p1  ORF type:complete len:672 (+),score=112.41 TRINITY_DN4041_c0_g1_i1:314-2329(+)